ncbi:MAG: hypothetical protein JXA37_13645 [Chloroflexia bacterium]|nr:hypothetical protein [Chloroflexia bacterium]
MNNRDPLESWLFIGRLLAKLPPEEIDRRRARTRADLQALDRYLQQAPEKGRNLHQVRFYADEASIGLLPDDLALAQDLYRRVYEGGGQGSHFCQESLLHLIAASENPASIPFWQEILGYSRPRDQFSTTRRTMALAALARLAISQGTAAACEALRQALRHDNADVRALAAYSMGRIQEHTERPPAEDLLEEVAAMARQDRAFAPRFQARELLRTAGQAVPLDNPGGSYAFKVKLKGHQHAYRTVELRSEQTLEDLHGAIQQAFDWDADHLYTFFLNGEKWDERYSFACPFEQDCPRWADEGVLGELGLPPQHEFLYYFDYGDGHQFEVQVVAIQAQAEPGEYPRLVDSRGEAPAQYGWYGEELDEF